MSSLELITKQESAGFRPASNDTYISTLATEFGCGEYKRITPIIKSIQPRNQPLRHENKLIDPTTKNTTTVYTDFTKKGTGLNINHNDFGKSHREKKNIYNDILPYNNND